MSKNWIDTISIDDVERRINRIWAQQKQDLQEGEFWADRIKRYRTDPDKRLRAALKELPLPAAFRHAAIAIRAIIRDKKKAKVPYASDLSFLYWLAAVNSLMVPYADRLKQPGFNVMVSIPGNVIMGFNINYNDLGHEQLELLNSTDRKWLVELWGVPENHSTLNITERSVWLEYEDILIRKDVQRNARLVHEIRSCIQPPNPRLAQKPKHPSKSKGFLRTLLGF